MMEIQEYKDNLIVKFEGPDMIDAETLTSVLDNTVKSLKKIAQFSIEERYEKFVIRDISKGSFIVDLIGIMSTVPGLVNTVGTAVTIFKDVLDIKKHLMGLDPKSVEKKENGFHIENQNGNIYVADDITFNIYTQNEDIDDKLTNIGKSIANDSQRTRLVIDATSGLTGEKDTIEISKEDAVFISKPVDMTKLNNQVVREKVRLKVRVKKADFESNSKWQIVILGESYNVKILDEKFRENLNVHKFTKGTLMDCELELTYTKKSDGTALNNKKEYKISRVFEVLNEEDQSQLELFD